MSLLEDFFVYYGFRPRLYNAMLGGGWWQLIIIFLINLNHVGATVKGH